MDTDKNQEQISANPCQESQVETPDDTLFDAEEIVLEEVAIDGICGVY